MAELLVAEARKTKSKYRVAHLVRISYWMVLESTKDLVDIYNKKFGQEYSLKMFLG